MAGTLPSLLTCCDPCDDPTVVQVPGPQGSSGAAGAAGATGRNAFTTFTNPFVMPALGASGAAVVGDTGWMAVNQILYGAKSDGSVVGYLQVTAITTSVDCTLKNLEDGTGIYAINSAPASVFTAGSRLCPSGLQGLTGTSAATAMAGHVTGTVGANELTLNSAKGALPAGNGSSAPRLSGGADG